MTRALIELTRQGAEYPAPSTIPCPLPPRSSEPAGVLRQCHLVLIKLCHKAELNAAFFLRPDIVAAGAEDKRYGLIYVKDFYRMSNLYIDEVQKD